MPKISAIDIRFPLGGLHKRFGYQTQPPFTTPDALNVRPEDTYEGRERGGSRPGLTKAFSEQIGAPSVVRLLAVCDVLNSVTGQITRILLAHAGGAIYTGTGGVFTALSIADTLQDENYVDIVDHLGASIETENTFTVSDDQEITAARKGEIVLIADFDDNRTSGTDGQITANVLTATGIADWTTLGIEVASDVIVIETGSSATETATYPIASIAAAGLTINTTPNVPTNTGGTDCTYTVARGPKIYTASTNAITLLLASAAKGQAPTGATAVAVYRDRAVWAKGHIWSMSRQGDHLDYSYSDDAADSARAVAATNAEAGQLGQPIVALANHGDDYLVFFCEYSIWVLRGDPAYGGQLDNLSHQVGLVGPHAWCYGPSQEIIFLSRDGLYVFAVGAEASLVNLSREKMPRELRDVDRTASYISMEYDSQDRGVHIFITPRAETQATHWWYDWNNQSFWPVQVPATMQAASALAYAESPSDSRFVMIGGLDGYVRRFSTSAGDDDGTDIEAYVLVGPYRLGGDMAHDGILSELFATMDQGSGSVTWSLRADDYAELAVQSIASAQATGTWSSGRSVVEHPRVRGGSAVLKIGSNGSTRWALESVTATAQQAGRSRV